MRIPRYELVDHTADLGIVLHAPDRARLYEDAALALFDILSDLGRVEPRDEQSFATEGLDRADLLVRWLGDLLSAHDADGRLFSSFTVKEITETALRATVRGERFDPERHYLKGELKAVTHHGALVEQDADGWMARVIFDV